MTEQNAEEVVEEVRWAKHYASHHYILLVGEGDFSFSHSIANTFGSAKNMIATSNDTRDALFKKYRKAENNVIELERKGAIIIHEVDATKLQFHAGLHGNKFDRIIYNFPHCGLKGAEYSSRMINRNKELLHGFFKSASCLLLPDGEIHVSHRDEEPYCFWNLKKIASNYSLIFLKRSKFKSDDYDGYKPRRGGKWKCDKSFPLGRECFTFKFGLDPIR